MIKKARENSRAVALRVGHNQNLVLGEIAKCK